EAEQEFAVGVERPGIAALHVFLRRNPPYRSRSCFRAAATRAKPEAALARLSGRPAHSVGRRGQGGIDPRRLMRIAAAFDKGADRRCRFRLTQQHAMHAAAEDLAELPG